MQRSFGRKLIEAPWGSLARGFYEYGILSHFTALSPRQLQINVTYRCNARCTMCNIWQMPDRHEMDLEHFRRVLDDRIFDGVDRLTLAGGEPSLRRDLVTLTEVFLNAMPRLASLTLITNGLAVERILADSRAMLALCAERGIHFNVSVSLDGVGAVHDEMRKVPGAFARVERCLAGLQHLQVNPPSAASGKRLARPPLRPAFWLGVSCVIARQNLHHLRQLQTWCAEHGLELGFQLVGFHETYVANVEQQEELDFGPKDWQYLFDFLGELAADRSPSRIMSYFWHDMLCMYRDGRHRQTPCPLARDSFVLDAYGDVYYCLSERKIGNCLEAKRSTAAESNGAKADRRINGGPISAIYYDPQNLAFRRTLTKSACLRCNSACFANVGIKKDMKKYLWFLVSGR